MYSKKQNTKNRKTFCQMWGAEVNMSASVSAMLSAVRPLSIVVLLLFLYTTVNENSSSIIVRGKIKVRIFFK